MARLLILLLALLTPAALVQARAAPPDRVVILISLDGFRADYLDKGVTPNLAELAKGGVNAAMRPSFPSKTFPNHWTLVTGMVPDHHGIVANRMEDPARPGELFTMASDDPFWWNTAEPIWAMAERAGIRTATMFWPGSDVGWGGTRSRPAAMTSGGERPSDWQEYNQAITNRQRIDAVLDWMRRPAAIRPRLVTLYFDTIDTAGHEFGPDDPRIEPALTEADARIGELVQGLRDMAIPADLVIVADHGMAATSSERVIALDRLADPALYRVIEQGSYAALVPTEGNEERLWKALSASGPNHTCWRKDQIPARLHYGASPRVPPIICLARSGWTITATAPDRAFVGGAHGYDPEDPAMAALFIGNGPSFVPGVHLAPFDNTAITPLLRHLLGLPPVDSLDGTIKPFAGGLRQ